MVSLTPIPQAVVPRNSDAARRVSAPNYDEFQSDREIWQLIKDGQAKVLPITMPHVTDERSEMSIEEGSREALELARSRMVQLLYSPDIMRVRDMLWVYEITNKNNGERQIGVGGYAKTGEIRTDDNPSGVILRNEEVREEKAIGRRDLIQATGSYIGVVNNAVEDAHGHLQSALEVHVSQQCNFETDDVTGEHRHRVWLVQQEAMQQYVDLLVQEPHAYVADGNHRSAAACMLGDQYFSAMFFPANSMRIGPYNRLIKEGASPQELSSVLQQLQSSFTVEQLACDSYQPTSPHNIGLYAENTWYNLEPLSSAYEQGNPVEEIDASIVHNRFCNDVLGIVDPRDPRLTFVGANKDSWYLTQQVKSGEYRYAVTVPPVAMRQVIDVCKAGQFMPPKTTWFLRKIISGLVIAER